MDKLIFGCGYLGMRVARLWLAQGDRVHVVTRTPERGKSLAEEGLEPILGDVTQELNLPEFDHLSSVLFAVGFDRSSGKSISEVYVDGLRRVLDALPSNLDRLIYISSTGVYGNVDGAWVDEDSECHPTQAGGQACLAAEQSIAAHPLGQRSVVLRLAGIYGPGRIPQLAKIQAGEALVSNPDGLLNLIHVDDAARVVLGSETHGSLPDRFVVADGHPVQRREFYAHLAELLELGTPQFELPASGTTTRGGGSKRIKTDKLRNLISELNYTDYRAGLAQIVESMA